VIGGFVAYRKFVSKEKGRLFMDSLKFKLPVFGNLNMLVANARFGHLAAAMYKSGLQLSKTLEIVGRTIGNKLFQKELQIVNEAVAKGSALSSAMEGRPFFAGLMVESVNVGEQTGALDEMMESTAQFYDEEVDSILDQLTTLIEPLLLVGIFGMVALLALAIFLPWWNITRLVLQGSGG
jgi:type IV pilus assembly protein PilC